MKRLNWTGFILLFLLTAVRFSPALAVDEARQAYDKMVEESSREADAYMQEKQKQMQEGQNESRKVQDAALQEKADAERERIINEMDTVQQRGLGPNFTQGMKDNRTNQLQQKLDRLMSDPETYFKGQ